MKVKETSVVNKKYCYYKKEFDKQFYIYNNHIAIKTMLKSKSLYNLENEESK